MNNTSIIYHDDDEIIVWSVGPFHGGRGMDGDKNIIYLNFINRER